MRVQSAVEREPTHRAKLAALARLSAFAGCLLAVVSSLAFQVVRADMRERLLRSGEAMMAYPGAPHESVRQLRLNGIDISFRARTIDGLLGEVLGNYAALCESKAIASDARRNRDAGYVACLAVDDTQLDMSTAVERLVQFVRAGKLLTLGGFRYAFAQRIERHANGTVFLLTAWSESTFDLAQLLPIGDGDAAGHDPPGLPRPAGTQRLLSAVEIGRPSGVFIYRAEQHDIDDLRAFYRQRLATEGWTIVERNSGESIQIDDTWMIAAERHGTLATVLLRSGDSGTPVLTILTSEPS
jgi:hypothetical protein